MMGLGTLMVGGFALWLLASYPAWLFDGTRGLLHSGVAMLACLVPAVATFWWAKKAGPSPEQRLLATLGGSGVRMFCALGAGLVLCLGWPETFTENLWIWIAAFYVVLLAMETVLLIRNKQNIIA